MAPKGVLPFGILKNVPTFFYTLLSLKFAGSFRKLTN